jgi:hypothetical protein
MKDSLLLLRSTLREDILSLLQLLSSVPHLQWIVLRALLFPRVLFLVNSTKQLLLVIPLSKCSISPLDVTLEVFLHQRLMDVSVVTVHH